MTGSAWDFLVDRKDLHRTEIREAAVPAPADGEVLFRVESFSLTANNITYAVTGDQIGYWRFFPKPEGWGCIPAWGYGVVEASASPDFKAGERFYGYWPMASHLLTAPRRSRAGFVDTVDHRAALPPVYSQYAEAPADEPHQDERSLLNPLFITSFLIDDLLVDNDDFGASTVLLSSASSRTALGLAWLLKRAGRTRVAGLTSPGNWAFVESLGMYDDVILYDDLAAAPVETPVVFVDFAGDPKVLAAVHNRFADGLSYSCLVGLTHWEAGRSGGDLPGPKPIFFFAPDRVVKRRQDWGPGGLEARYGEAWDGFVSDTPRWLTLQHHSGAEGVQAAFLSVLDGKTPPSVGVICRP